jgi:hypothetical protein
MEENATADEALSVALNQYKRELARWKRENRKNVEEYQRRVAQYKRRLATFSAMRSEILRKYSESFSSINTRYEKLMRGALLPSKVTELDLERRVKIADAIIARDRSLAAIGTPPIYPEFHLTEGKPQLPLELSLLK